MPAAEGDVVIVDVAVAPFYFPRQLALRPFGGAGGWRCNVPVSAIHYP